MSTISPANGAISIIAAGSTYQLRPAPLFSLSVKHNRNKMGYLGATYDINLNGYILDGMTAISGGGGSKGDSSSPYGISGDGLKYILHAQSGITHLFSNQDLTLEISDVNSDNTVLVFSNLQVTDINFEEGQNFNVSRYTISLTTNKASGIISPSPYLQSGSSGVIMNYDLEDFTETWSIDPNDSFGFEPSTGIYVIPRSYTASRTISATSRTLFNVMYEGSGVTPAWKKAKQAVDHYTSGQSISSDYFNNSLVIPSASYTVFNHSRTESIDKSAGTYTVTDAFFVGRSGDRALENYNMSINASRDNPYVKISVNGTIKGLSTWSAAGGYFSVSGGLDSPYNRAYSHYYAISNSGLFGPSSTIMKRVQTAMPHRINPQPLSVSLGTNEIAGEITYNLEFDNRPLNYFSGVMLENININDTYPGDVFATIPVLGRPTGPILQFTFGRTEYKRDLSVEILLDYSDIGYNQDRGALILRKPSINEPIRSQLNELIRLVSPGQEIGIRKYFLSNPPTESWNPKEGRYTLSLGWVYELSE